MHQTEIKVRGFHLDVFQHVNNARYLEFLEDARWHYFDDVELTPLFFDSGCGMAIVNINIKYRRSAYFGDDLLITTGFSKVLPRLAEIRQVISLKNSCQVVAEAKIMFVGFDQGNKKAISFPELLQDKMKALLGKVD